MTTLELTTTTRRMTHAIVYHKTDWNRCQNGQPDRWTTAELFGPSAPIDQPSDRCEWRHAGRHIREFDLAGYLPGVEIIAIVRVTMGEQP